MLPFDNISPKNRKKLLWSLEAHIMEFKPETNIVSIFPNDKILGVIEEGIIEVSRTDYNGNKTVIETLEENDIIGSALAPIKNGEFDVVVKETAKVIVFDYDFIVSFNENTKSYYNQFIKNLFIIITEKLNEKNERIDILTRRTIRNKLLEYFKTEYKKHGSRIIYLPFSFSDLANYLAVDRCAMTREIKALKDDGIITVKDKKIYLQN